eukprot:15324293-Ditylum_brightwellii.AAC.2
MVVRFTWCRKIGAAPPTCSLAFLGPMRQHSPSTSTPVEGNAGEVTSIKSSKNMRTSCWTIKMPLTKKFPWQGYHPTNWHDPSA